MTDHTLKKFLHWGFIFSEDQKAVCSAKDMYEAKKIDGFSLLSLEKRSLTKQLDELFAKKNIQTAICIKDALFDTSSLETPSSDKQTAFAYQEAYPDNIPKEDVLVVPLEKYDLFECLTKIASQHLGEGMVETLCLPNSVQLQAI